MSLRQFSNNANATFASGISSGSTSLTVTSGEGSLFPAISGSQYFVVTLIKASTPTVFEIVKVTGRSGDTFTSIVRAQEGTTALSWSAGDTVALLITAGDCAAFTQFDDLQTQATNYALDTGSANVYAVTLTPALASYVTGMPIRFLAAHTNTGASTLNAGPGALNLLTEGGANLPAGYITANGVYEAYYNGSVLVLAGANIYSFSQISGTVSNAQVPVGAVTQYDSTIWTSPAMTGTPTAPTAGTTSSGNTTVATTGFVVRGSSLFSTGYRKNPDGTITQWGRQAYSGSGSTLTVSFPTPFSSACWVLNVTSSIGGYTPGIQSLSTSSATLDMTNLGGTAQTFYWTAEGE